MHDTLIQAGGLLMFLAGLFLLAGLGWTLVVAGALTTAAAIAFEVQAGPTKKEVDD